MKRQTIQIKLKDLYVKHAEYTVKIGGSIYDHIHRKKLLNKKEMLEDINANDEFFHYQLRHNF